MDMCMFNIGEGHKHLPGYLLLQRWGARRLNDLQGPAIQCSSVNIGVHMYTRSTYVGTCTVCILLYGSLMLARSFNQGTSRRVIVHIKAIIAPYKDLGLTLEIDAEV